MWDKYILEVDNVLPKSLCERMIKNFEADDNKEDGKLPYCINGEEFTKPKYNSELDICAYSSPHWRPIVDELYKHVADVFRKYVEKLETDFNISDREHIYLQELNDIRNGNFNIQQTGFCIHKIKEGDKYSWHHDGVFFLPCFIQMIFYLNTLDEEEGGCTGFINGHKVRPEAGKVLVYPQSWLFPHCGNEVKRKAKYICTTNMFLYPRDKDLKELHKSLIQ
jgi:hypothetical protein